VTAALDECKPYAVQGVEGGFVQALASNDDESPAVSLKRFTPFDVAQPVGSDFGMVAAVVLDDELEIGIAEVKSAGPLAIPFAEDVVDLRFGQAAEDN
jgi:hypothetical protein